MIDGAKTNGTTRFLTAGYRIALYGAATYVFLAALLVTIGHAVNGPFMPLDGLFVLSAALVAVIAVATFLYRWVLWLRAVPTSQTSADGRSGNG